VALVVIGVGVVALPLIALALYVVHRIKLGRFKLSVSVVKVFSILIEVEAAEDEDLRVNDVVARPAGPICGATRRDQHDPSRPGLSAPG